MNATIQDMKIVRALESRGIYASVDQARTLRRAELTLHRWAEEECNGTIQRPDEGPDVGKAFRVGGFPDLRTQRYHRPPWFPIPDREAGALRRVAKVCAELGIFYFRQGDPRGCQLYVDVEPLPDHNYTRGISCCVG